VTAAHTRDLVADAVANQAAVLAFNVITLEHAEGIVAGLERAGSPGLLQVSENAVRYRQGRIGPLLAACRELAEQATVPIGLHLDHLQDPDLLADGVAHARRYGVSSLMVDAAHLAYDENVATTAALAQSAHRAGLWVEAELGEVGGKDGHAPGVRTDPDEAAAFVAATGVDGLAVAVGSVHAMTTATAHLDLDLIARLAGLVPVPLVLHGSSGVPAATLQDAVRAGIRKINIGTALNVALTAQVRKALLADDGLTDPRRYLAPARDAIADTVAATCATIHAA
jgi:fructose-bisphosphate aldolase class II